MNVREWVIGWLIEASPYLISRIGRHLKNARVDSTKRPIKWSRDRWSHSHEWQELCRDILRLSRVWRCAVRSRCYRISSRSGCTRSAGIFFLLKRYLSRLESSKRVGKGGVWSCSKHRTHSFTEFFPSVQAVNISIQLNINLGSKRQWTDSLVLDYHRTNTRLSSYKCLIKEVRYIPETKEMNDFENREI